MSKYSIDEIRSNVISAYDKIADSYSDTYSENDNVDFKYFKYFIQHIPGKKVLDMGCGVGMNAHLLSREGLHVFGIDASGNMLKIAKRKFPQLDFEQRDILYSRLEDNAYDGIVLAYVIEHFNDEGLMRLKEEIDRLLKKGGLLFIAAHVATTEGMVPDPLDESISIYYNFLCMEDINSLLEGYTRVFYETRKSYGQEEFIYDKMFLVFQKN